MAQRYDPQSGDPEDAEKARLEQEELMRQLTEKPDQTTAAAASATAPTAGSSKSDFPYTPPEAGKDLSSGVLEGHKSQVGALSEAASMASTGATIGSVIPGLGTLAGAGIGAGIGAIKGFVAGRSNDTKNEREQFAQSMGAPDSTALWHQLHDKLPADQAQELQDRALNRIGKHDTTANAQWMQDVQSALSAASAKPDAMAATTVTSTAPNATATAPASTAPPTDAAGWIASMLKKYASTDDPAYWQKVMAKDPNAMGSAQGYWEDRIMRGDGAEAVKNGTVKTYGSGSSPRGVIGSADGPSASTGLAPTDQSFYNELQKKLVEILGGSDALDREALLKQLTGK